MAEFDIKAIFKIEGLGELQKAFKSIGTAAGSVQKNFKAFSGAVGDTVKNVAKISTVAIGAATAVVALTKAQAAAAEQTLNLAKATGVSTEEIQTYGRIAEDAGVGQETFVKGISQLNKRLIDLRDTAHGPGKELRELDSGLAASIKSARNADDAFLIAKNRLGDITDEAKRAKIEVILFGKAGQALDPILSQNNKQFADSVQRVKNFGIVLSDLQLKELAATDDAFDNVGAAVSGLARGISAILAPAITQGANAFAQFIAVNRTQILAFVGQLTATVFPIVRDFFLLLTGGADADKVNATAKQIYDNFISIKNAVVTAVNVATTAFNALAVAIAPVAAVFGMSGKDFLITASILQLLGVFKIFTTGITLLLSSFNFLLVAFKAAPSVLTVLINIFGKLGPIIQILTVGIRLLWVAFTGPIGLVIAGVTLLAVVIYKVIDATIGWDKVLGLLGQAFTFLGTIALKAIQSILSLLLSIVVTIGQIIVKGVQLFVSFFATILNLAAGWIAKLAIAIGKGILDGFNAIKKALTDIVQFAIQKGADIFNGIINAIKNAVLSIVNSLSAAIKSIFDGVKNTITGIISSITSAINTVKSAVGSVVSAVSGSGSQKKVTTTTKVPGLAGGGLVGGVGGPTSDSNLILGSRGEFMMKAKAVRKFGVDFMSKINNGILPAIKGFADGGLIGGLDNIASSVIGGSSPLAAPVMATATVQSSGRPLHLHLPDGRVIKASVDNSTARNLEKSMRRSDNAKPARLQAWYK